MTPISSSIKPQTASIHSVLAALESGEISSLEITRQYLERAEDFEHLNAFISLHDKHALQAAETADRRRASGDRGKLLGIPIAVKDLIVCSYGKTTCGSRLLKDYTSPFDATAVERLLEAGAILIGKTNLDEFGMGSSTENSAFGSARNPWDESRVPGGSSGGSAVAVAAGLAPASLATDTGGSIRQPAAFCNLTGLKPTYGRVSRYGQVAFASSLDQIGPMARTVKDVALISEVIFGRDDRDGTSVNREIPPFTAELNTDLHGLRIGLPKEYFSVKLQPEIEAALTAAQRELESLGASFEKVSLPHTEAATATYYIIAPAEASSNLARFDGVRFGERVHDAKDLGEMYAQSRSKGLGDEVKRRILIGNYVLSSGYYEAFYQKAQKVRRLIQHDFLSVFEKECDVLLCPVTPTTAFPLGEKVGDPVKMYECDIFTVPANLAGVPALSIPCGFDNSGLPIGLQLIGKPWDEQLLFSVADAYQQCTEWHLNTPEH